MVVLNAAIADMDSESIGKVTSLGHQVLTRDDLDWLLGHMEGIKGPPPRPEEMQGHRGDMAEDGKSAAGSGALWKIFMAFSMGFSMVLPWVSLTESRIKR